MNNKYYSIEESEKQFHELKEEISLLNSEIEIMHKFFNKRSIPLIFRVRSTNYYLHHRQDRQTAKTAN